MGSMNDFSGIISGLTDDFLCIAADLPGHGRSLFKNSEDFHGAVDFPSLSRLILKDLDTLGVEMVNLYGYSMGGRAAQSLALESPERADTLILESALFGIEDQAERSARFKSDLSLLDGIESPGHFRIFLEKWHAMEMFATIRGTPLAESLVELKMANSVEELKKALKLMSPGNHAGFIQGLHESRIPVIYIHGSGDDKYSVSGARAKERIPRMEIYTVEDASHNVHARHPGIIVKIIREILEKK